LEVVMSRAAAPTSATGKDPHGSPPGRRRRGAELDAALLEAAWDELAAVGYPQFTLDGVAARAGTSRPVLARRWSSRTELVIAAIRHHSPAVQPDTGTLRGDVLTLLRQISASASEAIGVLTFVLADYFSTAGRPLSEIRQQAIADRGSIMAAIIERAVERGEIDPRRLTPHIATLPVDLVRHDLIMNQTPVPDETLIEIVDHIFLPLVRPQPPAAAGSAAKHGSGVEQHAQVVADRAHREAGERSQPWP
jgi:AcrR family transcriptional regulator